ncbi:MAG: AMP-binding protein [Planctomycetota bacterium]|nr:AMP-binding protein [Planctomycetota bacterium]
MNPSIAGKKGGDSSVVDRLEFHADRMPDRVLFTWLDDDGHVAQQFTFAQLAARAKTLAARFSEFARPGERALLLYPHGLEFIASFLGCLYAGVVAVPAYPPRRNRSLLRLTAIQRDARPSLILTTSEVAANLAGQSGNGAAWSTQVLTDQIATERAPTWSRPPLAADALAFIQYTSGSTGEPQGVMVGHGNIMANEVAIETAFRHSSESTVVGWLPMFHDMGLIGNVLQPLYTGFPSVLLSPVTFLREPIRWLRAISEFRATISGAPNFAFDHCVDRITEEEKDTLDLSSLAVLYNGAEPVRARSLERFAEAFARCGFRRETFFPCYGLAETTLLVTGGPRQRPPVILPVRSGALETHQLVSCEHHEPDAQVLVGCGRTAHGTCLEIVEPDTCRRAAPDAVGELWVSGPSVAQGYWNRPEETELTFRARLADTGEGPFLRTGDLGFIRDGEVFITGRIKDLMIIRGRNIYPHDVEAAVERSLPFVAANTCAAFATSHDDGERLTLVIEADRAMVNIVRKAGQDGDRGDSIPELGALVEQVREAIADEFEVTLQAVVFVRPGSFPRTSSGKVQRRACRRGLEKDELQVVYAWQAAGTGAVLDPGSDPVAEPATDNEARPATRVHGELVDFIQSLVTDFVRSQIDANAPPVPVDRPFAAIGLDDSLGAAFVGLAIEKRTGVRLTAEHLCEYPNVNSLAGYVLQCQESRPPGPCEAVCE